MKESPEQTKVHDNFSASVISKDGFMGSDTRTLAQIIEADAKEVARLGLTNELIAAALCKLTDAAIQTMGAPIVIEGYEVTADEAIGGIPCPFGHPPLHSKAIVTAVKLETGEKMSWTPLGVHLIAAHNFYQGRGSVFRLEPAEVGGFLGLV